MTEMSRDELARRGAREEELALRQEELEATLALLAARLETIAAALSRLGAGAPPPVEGLEEYLVGKGGMS